VAAGGGDGAAAAGVSTRSSGPTSASGAAPASPPARARRDLPRREGAVVDRDRCAGTGGAPRRARRRIFLSTGEAVQRVEVPDLDVHFQSNIRASTSSASWGAGADQERGQRGEDRRRARGAEARPPERRSRDGGLLDLIVVGRGRRGSRRPGGSPRGARLPRAGAGDDRRHDTQVPATQAPPRGAGQGPLYGDLWIADASKEALIKVWDSIIAETGLKCAPAARSPRSVPPTITSRSRRRRGRCAPGR